MPVPGLTTKRIRAAKPKRKSYIINDLNPKGLGLRVSPKGRKVFVISVMRRGIRHWEKIGTADTYSLKEARSIAKNKIAALTTDYRAGPDTPFEIIAEMNLRHKERLWRPSTREIARVTLNSSLLPYFKGRAISSITHVDVEKWYAGLHWKPGAATFAAKLLSGIMRTAEDMGARPEDSNPVSGLRYYRLHKRDRVLTPDEMARLGAAIKKWRKDYPLEMAQLMMLILTGCRLGEMEKLHWRDYRNGNLHLPDSKTGPKTIFLSSHARAVLDGMKTPRRGLVFPHPKHCKRGIRVNVFWRWHRNEIGLGDVRLLDLRHNYASVAVRSGENLVTIGKLLGHTGQDTTLGYAHLDDAMMRDAVAVVDGAMKSIPNKGGKQ